MSRRVVQGLALTAVAWGLAGATPDVTIRQDPTRPPSFAVDAGDVALLSGDPGDPSVQSNRLTTTVVSPGESFAVIDGAKVAEGEYIAGARVVRIDPAGVLLHGSGGQFELRFYAMSVKAPVGTELPVEAEDPPASVEDLAGDGGDPPADHSGEQEDLSETQEAAWADPERPPPHPEEP